MILVIALVKACGPSAEEDVRCMVFGHCFGTGGLVAHGLGLLIVGGLARRLLLSGCMTKRQFALNAWVHAACGPKGDKNMRCRGLIIAFCYTRLVGLGR